MELGLGAGATAGCAAWARETVVQVKELNAAFRASYQQIVFSPPAEGSDRQKSRQSGRHMSNWKREHGKKAGKRRTRGTKWKRKQEKRGTRQTREIWETR